MMDRIESAGVGPRGKKPKKKDVEPELVRMDSDGQANQTHLAVYDGSNETKSLCGQLRRFGIEPKNHTPQFSRMARFRNGFPIENLCSHCVGEAVKKNILTLKSNKEQFQTKQVAEKLKKDLCANFSRFPCGTCGEIVHVTGVTCGECSKPKAKSPNVYVDPVLHQPLKPCAFNHSWSQHYESPTGLLNLTLSEYTDVSLNEREQKHLFAILLSKFGETE